MQQSQTYNMQIVPRGMQLNDEMINRAREGSYYIKLGNKGGTLTVTGAPGYWQRDGNQNVIYIPSMRIAGTPEDITQVLRTNYNASDADIQQYISSGFTSQNYNVPAEQGGKAEEFDQEVEEYKKFRQNKENQKQADIVNGRVPRPLELSDLDWIIPGLPEATTAKSSGAGRRTPSKTKPTSGAAKGAKAGGLAQRIQQLAPGKVLDVSNMNESGTGIKTINQPGQGSKKFGVQGLPIVSSDATNFERALTELSLTPDQQQAYLHAYTQASAAGPQVQARPSPTRKVGVAKGAKVAGVPKTSKPKAGPVKGKVTSPNSALPPLTTNVGTSVAKLPQLAPLAGVKVPPNNVATAPKTAPVGLPKLPTLPSTSVSKVPNIPGAVKAPVIPKMPTLPGAQVSPVRRSPGKIPTLAELPTVQPVGGSALPTMPQGGIGSPDNSPSQQ